MSDYGSFKPILQSSGWFITDTTSESSLQNKRDCEDTDVKGEQKWSAICNKHSAKCEVIDGKATCQCTNGMIYEETSDECKNGAEDLPHFVIYIGLSLLANRIFE